MRSFALIALLPLAACSFNFDTADGKSGIPGSGSGTARSFAVADFSGVELRGSDDVQITQGSAFSVRAEGPAAELDRLKIEKIGDTLRIGRTGRSGFRWGNHESVKVMVTMPRIVAASIAGSGDMTVDRVTGASFKGETAGSGNLTVAALAVDKGEFSIAGSGDMQLSGTARMLSMSIAGSGNIDAGGVKALGADVSIAGSGGAKADVTGEADVSVMGSGDVDLGANAKCHTSKMGSGDVRCGG